MFNGCRKKCSCKKSYSMHFDFVRGVLMYANIEDNMCMFQASFEVPLAIQVCFYQHTANEACLCPFMECEGVNVDLCWGK